MTASTFVPESTTQTEQEEKTQRIKYDELYTDDWDDSVNLNEAIETINAKTQSSFPSATAYLLKTLKSVAETVGPIVYPMRSDNLLPQEAFVGSQGYFGDLPRLFREDGTGLSLKVQETKQFADEKNLDYAWFRLSPKKNAVLVQNPVDIKFILKENKFKLVMRDSTGSFEKIFGIEDNIFIVEPGEKLMKMQNEYRAVLKADSVLKGNIDEIQAILNAHLEKIEQNYELDDVEEFANSIAMEGISFTKLGMTNITRDTKAKITELIRRCAVEISIPYDQVLSKLFPLYHYLAKSEFFQEHIAKSKLLHYFRLARTILTKEMLEPNAEDIINTRNWLNPTGDKDLDIYSDKVWHRLVIFLVVAHETSANPMKFGLMLLADPKNASIVEKIRDELKDNPPETWTHDNMPDKPYLQAVIKEILRLYPPLPNLFYETKEALTFSKGTIAAGDMFIISPQCTHQFQTAEEKNDPNHWKHNPQEFNPERFLEKDSEGKWKSKKIDDYDYFPFGFQPRQCLGQFFASLEAKIWLGRIINKYDLTSGLKNANGELEPISQPYPYQQIFTLHLDLQNIHMKFTPREVIEKENALGGEFKEEQDVFRQQVAFARSLR